MVQLTTAEVHQLNRSQIVTGSGSAGQQLYWQTLQPQSVASIVINYEKLFLPEVPRCSHGACRKDRVTVT
jgi:hypothetical protein